MDQLELTVIALTGHIVPCVWGLLSVQTTARGMSSFFFWNESNFVEFSRLT